MEFKLFYSWQSDLPQETNEQFIEEAIKNVVQKIKNDSSLDVQLNLDRDIANVPGSPDIASTILDKIDRSEIFVCDVSIINNSQSRNVAKTKRQRLVPNPNVLVELGYALKKLGSERIVLINNLAFGKQEDLPFDFRHKHVVGYDLASNSSSEQHEKERQSLEKQLEQKFRQISTTLSKSISSEISLCDQAVRAIEDLQPNQKIQVKRFVDWAIIELEKIAPALDCNDLDVVLKSIDLSKDLVFDFTSLFSVAVSTDSMDAPFWIYKLAFEQLLNKYWLPVGFSGSFTNMRMHFYRCIGHELFISLIALLIERGKFELITNIMDETLFVESTFYSGSTKVPFTYISIAGQSARENIYSINDALGKKIYERHSNGELAKIIPSVRIVEADYFLSLRNGNTKWYSVISNHLLQTPKFLVEAYSEKYAKQLLNPLGLNTIDELKSLLNMPPEQGYLMRWKFNFNPNKIGTE